MYVVHLDSMFCQENKTGAVDGAVAVGVDVCGIPFSEGSAVVLGLGVEQPTKRAAIAPTTATDCHP